MADNEKIIDLFKDLMDSSDDPRSDFLKDSEHAHFLFNNDLDRWVPGTEDPIEANDGHPPSNDNMIQPLVLDAVSLLLKNYPMFRIKPSKPSDYDLSDEINKHVLAAWLDGGAQRTLQLSQLTALICGMSVLEVSPEWNSMGEISLKIELVPNSDIWFDPKEIELDKSWVIRRTWHTERELELDWGEKEISNVLGDSSVTNYMRSVGKDDSLPDWWEAIDDSHPLYTLWLPHSMYDPDMLGSGDINEAPFGRKIEILNGEILRDVPNPYAMPVIDQETGEPGFVGHKTHPYVLHECNRVVDEYGFSGVYDVKGLVIGMEASQWELNELSRILMQIGRRVAQPPMLVPEGSLTDPTQNISYTAGKVIQWDPAVSPTPPTAVPLPADVSYAQYLHQQRRASLRERSGIREMMTGGGNQPGTSHTPMGTIAGLQEASFTRMWTIVSALDRCITGVAKRILGLMQEFYQPGRFSSTSVSGDQWYGEWQTKHIETEFRIEIVSGMSTPLRDMDRVQTATQIYQAIGPILQAGSNPQALPQLQLAKAYLATINEPAAFEFMALVENYINQAEEEIRQREMMQQQQQMMQQQQQMQGGQPPVNGIPPEALEEALTEEPVLE